MQKLFDDTRLLDEASRIKYGLSEDIMMENAAIALEKEVVSRETDSMNVWIVCGSGNNGADGYALARRLSGKGKCRLTVLAVLPPKSPMCRLQHDRALRAGVTILESEKSAQLILAASGKTFPSNDTYSPMSDKGISVSAPDTLVECIFGSGFHGQVAPQLQELIAALSRTGAYRIACDMPSPGFTADKTVTMGALKTALYTDSAKDNAGEILCADLGISRSLFENASDSVTPAAMLLEESDLRLPVRTKQNVHKGTFGHAVAVRGEKPGAAIMAGMSALSFGAGLATLVAADSAPVTQEGELPVYCPPELMQSTLFPDNTTAVALGMGFGRSGQARKNARTLLDFLAAEKSSLPVLLDADLFYMEETASFLEKRSESVGINLVLTPHPKEFAALLEICGLGTYSVPEAVQNRMELSASFCSKFPCAALLVKGANPLISFCQTPGGKVQHFINPLGTSALAKGGSGDTLAGLILALLAQGYTAPDAALQGSLAHGLASRKSVSPEENFSLMPAKLLHTLSQ